MFFVPDHLPFGSAADSEEKLTSCDDSDYSSLDSDVEDISDTDTITPDCINYSAHIWKKPSFSRTGQYSSVNGQSNANTSTKTRNSHITVPSLISYSFIDI